VPAPRLRLLYEASLHIRNLDYRTLGVSEMALIDSLAGLL